jgi:hypothetical protein
LSYAALRVILLCLLLALPASARLRRVSEGLFLQDWQPRRVEFVGQGAQFSYAVDTLRMESAALLRYGLFPRLGVQVAFPFISESRGAHVKSGQGDLLATLIYKQPLAPWPHWQLGLAGTLAFPSGFREELTGFPPYTASRSQAETLLLLEIADSEGDRLPFWINMHGGLRTDNHRENTVLIWGASLRYDLFGRWWRIESEFDQEMRTDNKATSFQFFAGTRFALPLGFGLRLGAEQTFFGDLDRFGFYGGLSWQWSPRIPVELRHRHLRADLQRALDEKNRQIGRDFDAQSGDLRPTPERIPFLPLQIALLPFEESGGHQVAGQLDAKLRLALDADTSLSLIDVRQVQQVRRELQLPDDRLPDTARLLELGRRLGADYVLSGRILQHDPTLRTGLNAAPLLVRSRPGSRLEATAWLHDVRGLRPGTATRIEAEQHGRARWAWLHAAHGHRELPVDPRERSQLNDSVLMQCGQQTRDRLFYEVSVQRIVE